MRGCVVNKLSCIFVLAFFQNAYYPVKLPPNSRADYCVHTVGMHEKLWEVSGSIPKFPAVLKKHETFLEVKKNYDMKVYWKNLHAKKKEE